MLEPHRSFHEASLKISWAKKHINDLKVTIDVFMDSEPYRVAIQAHPESGIQSLDIFAERGIAAEIPLLIGDTIHALRCAFDYAWNGIERLFNPDRVAKLNFPFGETEESARATAKPALEKWAREDIANVVFDRIKPYSGGNSLIWAISKLDNRDKHNLLVPMLSNIGVSNIVATSGDGGKLTIGKTSGNIGDIMRFIAFTGPGTPKLESHGKLTADIVFGKGGPLEGEPVVETLVNMTKATDEALQLIREIF